MPDEFENDHVVRVGSARLQAGDHLAKRRVNVFASHCARADRMVKLTDLRALRDRIGDQDGLADQLGLQLLLLGVVGADRRDERARPHMFAAEKPLVRRRASDADVAGLRGRAKIADVDIDAGCCLHLCGEARSGVRVPIHRVDAFDRPDGQQRPQLDPALRAAAADRGDARFGARKMAGGECGRGSGALNGDLDRIHNREGPSVRRVRQDDHALDRRQARHARIVGEISVALGGEIRARAGKSCGLDVEAAARHRHAEGAGRRHAALRLERQSPFDGGDARFERKECRDIRAAKQDDRIGATNSHAVPPRVNEMAALGRASSWEAGRLPAAPRRKRYPGYSIRARISGSAPG